MPRKEAQQWSPKEQYLKHEDKQQLCLNDCLERISPQNLTFKDIIFMKIMSLNSESKRPIPNALYFKTSILQGEGSLFAAPERFCRGIQKYSYLCFQNKTNHHFRIKEPEQTRARGGSWGTSMRFFQLPSSTLSFRLWPEPFLLYTSSPKELVFSGPQWSTSPSGLSPPVPFLPPGMYLSTVLRVASLFSKEGFHPVFSSIFPKPLGIKSSENKPPFIFGVVLESNLEMVWEELFFSFVAFLSVILSDIW